MKEIWKDVPEYEGYYQVSNLGEVKSVDREITYKTGQVVEYKGVILKPKTSKYGYKEVNLHINKKTKMYKVHRLVAQVFIINFENKPQVNHIDGNKANNTVDNLEWCTPKENMQHAIENKLVNSRMYTEEEVDTIRDDYLKNKGTHLNLAKKYGIEYSTINGIIKNKSYYDPRYSPLEENYKGSKNISSKFTEEDVKYIRDIYYKTDLTYKEIGEMYETTGSAVGLLIRNKTYIDVNYIYKKKKRLTR